MRKILLLAIIFLFLFLRFYKIDSSLFFFNDMGRDLLVLQEWQERSKPPLLGPQTSALPINQSPIYFYYLYPFYLLTQGSVYTTLIANTFLYLSFFIFTFFYFKKYSSALLIVFFLISIHPQYIIQSRFVWNPSLLTPFIIIGLLSHLSKKPFLAAFSFAASISLSYSTAPLLFAILITYAVFYRPQIFKFILGLASGLFILNLPMLIFEIKYKFQLTKSLLLRGSEPQVALTIVEKTRSLSNFIFDTPNSTINLIIYLGLLIIAIIIFFRTKNQIQKVISFIFLTTILITHIVPIAIQPHYIFGFTSLIFLIIALLSPNKSLFLVFILALTFLLPSHLYTYYRPAPRTSTQMSKCFTDVCSQLKTPIFISVNSSYHPYHYGPEHHFLAKKSGCIVNKIETNPSSTNTMLVVGDGQDFEPQKTQYYELTQFGPYVLTKTTDCLLNFKIYQITKI